MRLKAIMVDVDGVIVRHPDPLGWTANLKRDLGLSPNILRREFFGNHWPDVVNGRASLRERLSPVLGAIAPGVSPDDLIRYWFENDAHLDHRLMADLASLRATGLQLHLATVQEHERAAHLWNELGLGATFDGMHYAADLGHSKPAAEFFHAVEGRTGFAPGELLLLDDQAKNVAGAIACGWHAALWTGDDPLATVLAAAGFPIRFNNAA